MAVNPTEDARVRHACDKLLIAYGIGEPPKVIALDAESDAADAMGGLTLEEMRNLARQSLVEDAPEADDADADDDPETEH